MNSRHLIIAVTLCLLLIVTLLALPGCAKEAGTGSLPVDLPTSDSPPLLSPEFIERLTAIEPYEPPPEPERYYNGAVGEFIPSQDYGRVYPYIGQVQKAKPNSEGYWFPSSCLYGFVDEKGRIICDPVYDKAMFLSFGNKAAYVMQKTAFRQGVVTYHGDFDGEYMEWSEDIRSKQEGHYIVVSLDGSFAGSYEDVYYDGYYEGIKAFEYIPVCKDGLWGVIDYDGTEILPCKYYNEPLFSEGLAAVYKDDNNIYYYIDPTGNQVLGPFNPGEWLRLYDLTFSHGRAMVTSSAPYISGAWNDAKQSFDPNYSDNRTFLGFIDTDGQIIIPIIYSKAAWRQKGYDKNGLAAVLLMETTRKQTNNTTYISFDNMNAKAGIIDVNGKYVVSLRKTTWTGRCQDRAFFQEGDYYFFSGDKGLEIFNKAGEKLKANDSIKEYRKCLEGDIFTTDTGIVNIKTGEVYYSGETPYIGNDEYRPWGAPYGGSEVIQLDGRPCVLGYLWNWKHDYFEPCKFGVLDKNGPVIDFEYENLVWMGEYFCAVQGNYGGLLKPDGTWFFKVEFKNIPD